MPKAIKRVALTISFIALAAGGVGLVWILEQPDTPITPNAIGTGAPQDAETASPIGQSNSTSAGIAQPQTATAPGIIVNAPTTGAPAGPSGRNLQLKPFVALAITQPSGSVEELCPELAQEAKDRPPSASTAEHDEEVQGCVLPIGGEQAAPTQQASMPLESERPPAPFPKKGTNYLPLVGGLGAAVSGIPVIAGLAENKDSSQPVSPD